MTVTATPFRRDRFTWVSYFMLSYFAYIMATLGPMVPFLREELDMNYTVSALYISAFAMGMIIAGSTADRVAKRLGRPFLFWGGGAGMAFGAVLLILGQSTAFTIASTFLLSLLGCYLLVMIQATLSDHHGENRAYPLTESNVFAVLAASAAPILVGLSEANGLGWRFALIVGIAAWGLVFIWARRHVTIPDVSVPAEAADTTVKHNAPLPRIFWAFWLIVFFSVAIEWGMIFWASTYMETIAGLSKEAAATSVSLFTFAQVIGRAAGSWLTRHYATVKLLLIAGAIIMVGFPLFWLGRTALLNAVGLFLCGLGVANLFPLTLSSASTVGLANPNAASARISMGSGLAILIAPQVLGTLGDRIGIQGAYGLVAPLVIGVIVVTLFANRMVKR